MPASNWLWRFKTLLRRREKIAETADELQLHLQLELEAGLRLGLSESEARRRARLRLGLLSNGLESANEEFGFRWLDGLTADFRHAWRSLIRNRGFSTVAVSVLASSVAINTLIFCILNGVILRPLPYAAPERLVRLFDASTGDPKFPMSIGHFLDYQQHAASLESIALYSGRDVELSGNTPAESRQLSGMMITPDYFAVLGQPAARGRVFSPADMLQTNRNAIISYRLWQTQFQSDPDIVGKPIHINREPWTIVGVAANGLQHPGGLYRSPLQGETVDIWLPLPLDLPEQAIRAYHFCNSIARLRPAISQQQASQDLTRLADLYAKRYPNYGTWSVHTEPLLSEVTGPSRDLLWLLAAAGALVLLVASANVAGLSMARGVARRGELALRTALGANSFQLVRVGLAENLLLGLAGAGLGLALAAAGLPLLHQLLPADFPRAHEISGLTWTSAFFATFIAIATAGFGGLLPAKNSTLDSQRTTASRDSRRLRHVLVASEIALAGLLCAGALFLLRSYQELGARDHGFQPENTLTFRLTLQTGVGRAKPGVVAHLYENLAAHIREVPGVIAVGASTNLPWSGYDENTGFTIVGSVADKNDEPGARYQAATPGYFEATGMRLKEGRFFDWTRDAFGQPPSIIVNDALVKRYFPDGHAVGRILDTFEKRQIVGVVMGIRDQPADLKTKPAFWFPLTQVDFVDAFFAVRARPDVDPVSLTAAITNAVHAVDPQLPLADVCSLERRASAAMASRRFALWLFQSFAALALILAAAGVYGLLAYIVQQRRKELSIRMALGASRAALWRMVLGDGLRMAATGAACCLVLIPLGGYLLRTFLFQVQAFDPVTVAGAPLVLFVIAAAASLGPAWTAMHSDPAKAFREE